MARGYFINIFEKRSTRSIEGVASGSSEELRLSEDRELQLFCCSLFLFIWCIMRSQQGQGWPGFNSMQMHDHTNNRSANVHCVETAFIEENVYQQIQEILSCSLGQGYLELSIL